MRSNQIIRKFFVIASLFPLISAFTTKVLRDRYNTCLSVIPEYSRGKFLKEALIATVAGNWIFHEPLRASASESDSESHVSKSSSMAPCRVQSGSPTNCVSTSSVKQVDCYVGELSIVEGMH